MGCEIGRIRPTNVFERAGKSRMTPLAIPISSQASVTPSHDSDSRVLTAGIWPRGIRRLESRRGSIVKLKLTAVFDAQHGGFTAGWSPVFWGSIDELFVNLTMPGDYCRGW